MLDQKQKHVGPKRTTTVPASPASDPVNADGERTVWIDGKLVVVPVIPADQQSGQQ